LLIRLSGPTMMSRSTTRRTIHTARTTATCFPAASVLSVASPARIRSGQAPPRTARCTVTTEPATRHALRLRQRVNVRCPRAGARRHSNHHHDPCAPDIPHHCRELRNPRITRVRRACGRRQQHRQVRDPHMYGRRPRVRRPANSRHRRRGCQYSTPDNTSQRTRRPRARRSVTEPPATRLAVAGRSGMGTRRGGATSSSGTGTRRAEDVATNARTWHFVCGFRTTRGQLLDTTRRCGSDRKRKITIGLASVSCRHCRYATRPRPSTGNCTGSARPCRWRRPSACHIPHRTPDHQHRTPRRHHRTPRRHHHTPRRHHHTPRRHHRTTDHHHRPNPRHHHHRPTGHIPDLGAALEAPRTRDTVDSAAPDRGKTRPRARLHKAVPCATCSGEKIFARST
jgi:hypothetical protein